MLGFNTTRTQRAGSAAAQARARCAARAQQEAADAAEEPAGGGWFDSSHDLLEGLTVVEHEELRGATLDLALALWLQ